MTVIRYAALIPGVRLQVEMVRDLSKDLEVCMQSTNTYVQKKVRLGD